MLNFISYSKNVTKNGIVVRRLASKIMNLGFDSHYKFYKLFDSNKINYSIMSNKINNKSKTQFREKKKKKIVKSTPFFFKRKNFFL